MFNSQCMLANRVGSRTCGRVETSRVGGHLLTPRSNFSIAQVGSCENLLQMDPDERQSAEKWTKSSSGWQSLLSSNASFTNFNSLKRKWDGSSVHEYRVEQQLPVLSRPFGAQNSMPCYMNNQNQMNGLQDKQQMHNSHGSSPMPNWDPNLMLNNLLFLENKIHHLQELVHLIVGRREQATCADELLVQQQHLITAEFTSVIVQLMSTAGSLLPTVGNTLYSGNSVSPLGPLDGIIKQSSGTSENAVFSHNSNVNKVEHQSGPTGSFESGKHGPIDDHGMKSDDDVEGENLSPGSYVILQLEKEEILAPHTHFCSICAKGFKRDANLRMHMRGHGDEYKTPAALTKPNKESSSDPLPIRRYSCPYVGCKRNKDHEKFQPLKTILCVKNHYKRTHCDKTYMCSRCNAKKFSVIADLKTHEKHCGRDKWICSCGTTFSRKDKLLGHISHFKGHSAAVPVDESKGSARQSDQGQCHETTNKAEPPKLISKSGDPSGIECEDIIDIEGCLREDPSDYLKSLGFDAASSSIENFNDFAEPTLEDSNSSLTFLLSEVCDYPSKCE